MKGMRGVCVAAGLLILICMVVGAIPAGTQQQPQLLSKDGQFMVAGMLHTAYNDFKKYYYDPNLRALDWDARYQKYSSMIGSAHDLGDGFRIVASFLNGLQDSHAYFIPPKRPFEFDSGYRLELIGDNCFIAQVRPQSDADGKLHIGDQVIKLDNFDVNRGDFHDMRYFFEILSPQPAQQFDVRSPTGETRRVVVNAHVRETKKNLETGNAADIFEFSRRLNIEEHEERLRMVEQGGVAFWKLQEFVGDDNEGEKALRIAGRNRALVLDLRGNGGGSVETLQFIVGALFDHDVKICDRAGRKENKPLIAKHHGTPFKGQLIVLTDSGSGSASEIFARVMQLEHRGTVIGDTSAGAVMEARLYVEQQGGSAQYFYGFSVTDANLVMTDGKSLEKVGVVPDEVLLPTGADLAAGRDPVLARAAELAGVKLDPKDAGKMFPYEWAPLQK